MQDTYNINVTVNITVQEAPQRGQRSLEEVDARLADVRAAVEAAQEDAKRKAQAKNKAHAQARQQHRRMLLANKLSALFGTEVSNQLMAGAV